MGTTIPGTSVEVLSEIDGLAVVAIFAGGTPPTTASAFAPGCELTNVNSGVVYVNTGTTASPVWAQQGVTAQALTTAANGAYTAIINEDATHVTITSGGATEYAVLPSGAAAKVGKTLTIWVGANGFELVTASASGATINNVDSDGTNQVDIAANTLSELRLVATDTWLLRSNTALGAVATALIPDND